MKLPHCPRCGARHALEPQASGWGRCHACGSVEHPTWEDIAEAQKGDFLAWKARDDKPLPEDDEIDKAFPTNSGSHAEYVEAMRLVGARYSKGGLVALVNWLLLRIKRADECLAVDADLIAKAMPVWRDVRRVLREEGWDYPGKPGLAYDSHASALETAEGRQLWALLEPERSEGDIEWAVGFLDCLFDGSHYRDAHARGEEPSPDVRDLVEKLASVRAGRDRDGP